MMRITLFVLIIFSTLSSTMAQSYYNSPLHLLNPSYLNPGTNTNSKTKAVLMSNFSNQHLISVYKEIKLKEDDYNGPFPSNIETSSSFNIAAHFMSGSEDQNMHLNINKEISFSDLGEFTLGARWDASFSRHHSSSNIHDGSIGLSFASFSKRAKHKRGEMYQPLQIGIAINRLFNTRYFDYLQTSNQYLLSRHLLGDVNVEKIISRRLVLDLNGLYTHNFLRSVNNYQLTSTLSFKNYRRKSYKWVGIGYQRLSSYSFDATLPSFLAGMSFWKNKLRLAYSLQKDTDKWLHHASITCDIAKDVPVVSVKKPVIYLYPQQTDTIDIALHFNGTLDFTYPEYNKGWSVQASPTGKLINLSDQSEHQYLFWDGEHKGGYLTSDDKKEGFVVEGKNVVKFLKEKLIHMGLKPNEYNDFITFWAPMMIKNNYNYVHFITDEKYDRIASVDVSPKPETSIRIFMHFQKLEAFKHVTPQKISPVQRKGYTYVEWGGTELPNEDYLVP